MREGRVFQAGTGCAHKELNGSIGTGSELNWMKRAMSQTEQDDEGGVMNRSRLHKDRTVWA